MLKYRCHRLIYVTIQYYIEVSCGHGTASGFLYVGYILKFETYSRPHCVYYNNVSFRFSTECSFIFLVVFGPPPLARRSSFCHYSLLGGQLFFNLHTKSFLNCPCNLSCTSVCFLLQSHFKHEKCVQRNQSHYYLLNSLNMQF